MKAGDRIPDALLDQVVAGVNLAPGTLREQLDDAPTLLVFLRHFGCAFCRETLADMRAVSERDPRFPKALFFFQGSPIEGKAFLRRYWPTLRAVSDPTGELYEGFGIRRAGLVEALGPRVWAARSRAAKKGHRSGERSGDIWRMPGTYLIRDSEVLWVHTYRHAADHPDYEEISRLAEAATAGHS